MEEEETRKKIEVEEEQQWGRTRSLQLVAVNACPPVALGIVTPWLGITSPGHRTEASPQKRRLKCDTKHQSQEADATFITSDGSLPYKPPRRTLDTDDNKK